MTSTMSTTIAPKRENRDAILSSLPPPYLGDLRSQIKQKVSDPNSGIPLLVILDDDPTGTQTCHDIQVLMTWDVETLKSSFTSDVTKNVGGFFILTNSRALHPHEARELIKEICSNLKAAAKEVTREFEIVLRSDSTLRGHFPLEADVASEVLGEADLWVLAPFFLQGGRYTIDDVHYVDEEGTLVPADETQFAKDATFGYQNSNLKDWVVEKTEGAISRDRVHGLSIQDIRKGGPDRAAELLTGFAKGSVVIVNAASEADMDVVVLGLLQGMSLYPVHGVNSDIRIASKSRKFLYRSGAALVSSRLGIAPIPPKTAEQLHLDQKVGGLVIAGSYVPKTGAQLDVLRQKSGSKLKTIILDVKELLQSPENAERIIREAQETAAGEIESGQDVLVMTSRELVTGKDGTESLNIGSTVAKALVSFLQGLGSRPRYIIAKVGIVPFRSRAGMLTSLYRVGSHHRTRRPRAWA